MATMGTMRIKIDTRDFNDLAHVYCGAACPNLVQGQCVRKRIRIGADGVCMSRPKDERRETVTDHAQCKSNSSLCDMVGATIDSVAWDKRAIIIKARKPSGDEVKMVVTGDINEVQVQEEWPRHWEAL